MKKLLLIAMMSFSTYAFATDLQLKDAKEILAPPIINSTPYETNMPTSTSYEIPTPTKFEIPIPSGSGVSINEKTYRVEFELNDNKKTVAKGELGAKSEKPATFEIAQKGKYLKVINKNGKKEEYDELSLGLEVAVYIKETKEKDKVEVKFFINRQELVNMVAFSTGDETYYLPEIENFQTTQFIVLKLGEAKDVFNTTLKGVDLPFGKTEKLLKLNLKVTEVK